MPRTNAKGDVVASKEKKAAFAYVLVFIVLAIYNIEDPETTVIKTLGMNQFLLPMQVLGIGLFMLSLYILLLRKD